MKNATVTGPASGGTHGWAFCEPIVDERNGYRFDEFFIEGVATRYRPTTDELPYDGRWEAEPVETAPFKTRLMVLRPIDDARFNGTVVAVWNNVSGGFDVFGYGDDCELFDSGYAVVGVTAQRVGVHGAGDVPMGLTAWDAERYGSLSIPSDDYSYDVFTQAVRAVGPGRERSGVDPLDGLDVRQVIATGGSQSAFRLATYLNAMQPMTDAVDGFLLTLYFGTGAPLEAGDKVLTSADPERIRRVVTQTGKNLLRDDLVPVILLNSEGESVPCHSVRQPDTDDFRWWEIAGTAHSSEQVMTSFGKWSARDLGIALPVPEGMNRISTRPVTDAAFHHLRRWIADGTPPPIQPRIEFAGDPAEIVRDADGIAKGGIRLPQADVPIAVNSALPASDADQLSGSCIPFSADELRARYSDRDSYLTRFEAAARTAVDAGALLPRGMERLINEARADYPLDA
jgi:hypothetical protein